MGVLLVLLVLAAALVCVVWLYIKQQGDAEFEFLVNQRTPFALVEKTTAAAVFSSQVPFVNKGPQDGTIMDCFTRHFLPQEQYYGVKVESRIELETARREDGYFEALIQPKKTGQGMIVTVTLTAKNGDILTALRDMVDLPIDIVYQAVGRSDWYLDKQQLVMTREEIAAAAGITLAEA